MTKRILFLLLASFFILFGLKNLGYFFDITKQPKTADLIVSLGGAGKDRIKKAEQLYGENLSQSRKIILTGVAPYSAKTKLTNIDERISYLTKRGISLENILLSTKTNNTLQEIKFIKQYMINNHLKSVLVVSDSPHSRRILFFANTVLRYPQSGLEIRVVSSDAPWWNTETYYTNMTAITFIFTEFIKYICYSSAYYLGYLK